jgi:hypothetical protein
MDNVPKTPEMEKDLSETIEAIAATYDDAAAATAAPPLPSSSEDTTIKSTPTSSSIVQKAENTIKQHHQQQQQQAKKRKAPAVTVNLLKIVNLMSAIYADVEFNEDSKFVIPKIMNYVNNEEILNKRFKCDEEEKKSKDKLSTSELNKRNRSETLYRNILILLLMNFEEAGATFQFSKEALKYFLATHSRFLSHKDFINNNSLNEKRKNMQQLSPGGILTEYTKGLDAFKNNIVKSDKDDIVAIKTIIENKIVISPKIYDIMRNANKHIENKYELFSNTNNNNHNWNEYARINIGNFKRTQLLISRSLVLVKDESQNQYMLPTMNMEKDITSTVITECKFESKEYAIFDVLVGSKNKIIDILYTNISNTELSESYKERLEFITNRFPKLKCVQYENTANTLNSNCIMKPLYGRQKVSYVYLKPSLTAAVIGTSDNYACLAFMINENELGIRAKYNISGPAAYLITTAEYQQQNNSSSSSPTISYNEKQFNLSGDFDTDGNLKLFKEAIPVEIKDGHKLGNFSERSISLEDEYKQTIHSTKDTIINETLSEILNDPRKTEEFIILLKKSSDFDRFRDAFNKTSKSSDLKLNFGKY